MSWLEELFGRASVKERLTPEEKFARVDEEVVVVARKLKEIREHPGLKMLLDLVERRRQGIATTALYDETRTKDFWQGYASGADGLKGLIDGVLGAAESAEQDYEAEEGARRAMSTEGGDFSI